MGRELSQSARYRKCGLRQGRRGVSQGADPFQTQDPAMSDSATNPESADVVGDATYRVTANELRQFVERIERLDSEKKDLAEQQKEVMAEAKSRGYKYLH
tara:strand:- start:24180 stop:24479 length:300 start_codon:yes stop_codon:yes gene_type:complete